MKTRPYALRRNEGQQLQSMGAALSVKANSEQTDGEFNLFDVTCPPGLATPLHIHYIEDVAIFVLEGALTFFWGSEKKKAEAGSFFFQPRGTPHGFRVEGTTPARFLYMAFPAGVDRFFVGSDGLASCVEAVTTAARCKIEVLGPLPE